MNLLEKNVKITNIIVILVIILSVGTFLRLFQLERMAYHHDESMHAYYSYRLYLHGPNSPETINEMSHYDPVYHGPFLYHICALTFGLFGDTDFTGRLPFAIFGVLTLLLAYMLHPLVGRGKAILGAFLLAISPTMVYFSRFARNDVFIGAENLALVVFSILYFKTRKPVHFYLAALALILGYCTKENSYMSGAILGSFLVLYVICRFLYILFFDPKEANRFMGVVFSGYHQYTKLWAVYGLFSCFMFTFVYLSEVVAKEFMAQVWVAPAYWVFAAIVSLAVLYLLSLAHRKAQPYDPFSPKSEKVQEKEGGWIHDFVFINRELFIALFLALAIYGIYALESFWWQLAILAVIVLLFLAASFLSVNKKVQSQETVPEKPSKSTLSESGTGTDFVLVISLCLIAAVYVFLFTTMFSNPGGLHDGVYNYLSYWMGQQENPRIEGPWYYFIQRIIVYETTFVLFGILALVYIIYRFFAALVRDILNRFSQKGKPETAPEYPSAYPTFLLYWSIMSLAIYSQLNEKVPWLIVHQALPMALLTAWFVVEIWGRLTKSPEQVESEPFWMRIVPAAAKIILLLLLIFFVGFQIRSTCLLNMYNNDDPKEMMVFVQSQHDVVEIMEEIEEIGFKTTKGKNVGVFLQGKTPWPFSWYLRQYKSLSFGDNPGTTDAEVVLCDATVRSQFKNALGDDYDEGRIYKLQGWWVTNYSPLFNIPEQMGAFRAIGHVLSTRDRWLPRFISYYVHRKPWGETGSWDICMFLKQNLYGLPTDSEMSFQPGYKQSARMPNVLETWGAAGNGPGMFNAPKGIAVAPDDSAVYVADTGNQRIQKFDSEGNFLLQWGGPGQEPGKFKDPAGLAVGPDGMVYVADMWNLRIQKFNPNGRFIKQWQAQDGRFFGPRDIAVDPKGEIFVTDTGNKRIMVYSPEGRFLRKWGEAGRGDGTFNEPVGIAVTENEVYVADTGNQRVQVFDKNGRFIRQWPVLGWEGETVSSVQPYIAVDNKGNVYCTDTTQNLVHRFLPEGSDVTMYSRKGSGKGYLNRAVGIAVDSNDNVYVSDTENNRIQKWAPLPHYK